MIQIAQIQMQDVKMDRASLQAASSGNRGTGFSGILAQSQTRFSGSNAVLTNAGIHTVQDNSKEETGEKEEYGTDAHTLSVDGTGAAFLSLPAVLLAMASTAMQPGEIKQAAATVISANSSGGDSEGIQVEQISQMDQSSAAACIVTTLPSGEKISAGETVLTVPEDGVNSMPSTAASVQTTSGKQPKDMALTDGTAPAFSGSPAEADSERQTVKNGTALASLEMVNTPFGKVNAWDGGTSTQRAVEAGTLDTAVGQARFGETSDALSASTGRDVQITASTTGSIEKDALPVETEKTPRTALPDQGKQNIGMEQYPMGDIKLSTAGDMTDDGKSFGQSGGASGFEQKLTKVLKQKDLAVDEAVMQQRVGAFAPESTHITETKAVESAELTAKPVFEQVAQKVIHAAEKESPEGTYVFDMKLFPEGLGKVEVRMTCQDGTLTLLLTAHSGETAKLLSGQSDELRSVLTQNYQVSDLHIRVDGKAEAQAGMSLTADGFGSAGRSGSGNYGQENCQYEKAETDDDAFSTVRHHLSMGILDTKV